VLDGQTVVRERCENSNIATYLTSARGIEYRRDDTAEDPGDPTRHVVRWYLYDGLGSVIAEVGEEVFTETDGSPCVPVLGVNRLDVYGNDLGGSSGASSHKFVGKLGHTTEADTGLIYMRARWYDPVLGRFISEDPAGDGVNWYMYCNNNPVNMVDSNGEAARHVIAYWLGVGFALHALFLLWSVRTIPVNYATEPILIPTFWQAVSESSAAVALFGYSAYGLVPPNQEKNLEIAAGVIALQSMIATMCRGTASGMKTAARVAVGSAFLHGLSVAAMVVLTDVL